MKMYGEAISDYTQAIEIDPTWYHFLLSGETKIEMGDREGECADF